MKKLLLFFLNEIQLRFIDCKTFGTLYGYQRKIKSRFRFVEIFLRSHKTNIKHEQCFFFSSLFCALRLIKYHFLLVTWLVLFITIFIISVSLFYFCIKKKQTTDQFYLLNNVLNKSVSHASILFFHFLSQNKTTTKKYGFSHRLNVLCCCYF